MNDNPFSSPQTNEFSSSSIENKDGKPDFPLASKGKRFLNFIIDAILINISSYILGFIIGLAIAIPIIQQEPGISEMELTRRIEETLGIWGYVIGYFYSILYFTIFEYFFHRSIGKLITGTKVVTIDGGSPSFGQVLGRTLSRFIPFEPFSFLSESYPRGWHDKLSSTSVVDARA